MKKILFSLLLMAFCLDLSAQMSDKLDRNTPQDERAPNAPTSSERKPNNATKPSKPAQKPTQTAPATPNTQSQPATAPAATPAPAKESTPASVTQPTEAAKQPSESPAAAAKRKLIADGYQVCQTHPDYGKIYCKKSTSKGQSSTYFYIDEDGIAIPIDRSLLERDDIAQKKTKSDAKTKQSEPSSNPAPSAPAKTEPPKTGFRIIEAFASGPTYFPSSNCPQKITFHIRLTAVGGTGTVSYKWLFSDGGNMPLKTVYFEGPGSKDVEIDWTPGAPYTGWVQLQAFDPNDMLSEKINFTVSCR